MSIQINSREERLLAFHTLQKGVVERKYFSAAAAKKISTHFDKHDWENLQDEYLQAYNSIQTFKIMKLAV